MSKCKWKCDNGKISYHGHIQDCPQCKDLLHTVGIKASGFDIRFNMLCGEMSGYLGVLCMRTDIPKDVMDKGKDFSRRFNELCREAMCEHDGEKKNGVCLECGKEIT